MEKIFIVDDSEMNREILKEMLGDEYEIIEADNGKEALAVIQERGTEISLVLLDMIMPEMNGLEVLEVIGKGGWLTQFPVIMISSEDSPDVIHKAYELGVTEFISRPFDYVIVHKRCRNVLAMYSKQKKLAGLFADQFYEREKTSRVMINILAHIVEFRNNECADHVVNVQSYTEILLRELANQTDKYELTEDDIVMIATVSALHDIGKISIPDEILNKPGRLTDEEFKIMKSHAAVGSQMLDNLPPQYKNEKIVKLAYAISRWHHERWDGRGYPDGLVGDDIPIAAQVVSMADVYDALTAERCYKKAFSHETALEMITKGECGSFNPLLLKCLNIRQDEMRKVKEEAGSANRDETEIKDFARELLKNDALYASDRLLHLLQYEKMKNRFFEAITGGCSFEYSADSELLNMSPKAAKVLNIAEAIVDPVHDESLTSLFGGESMKELSAKLRAMSPENPILQMYLHQIAAEDGKTVTYRITGSVDDVTRSRYPAGTRINTYRLICRTTWTIESPQRYTGAIGKLIPNENEYGLMKGVDIVDIKGSI